jgi:hypothetical protein
MASEIDPLDRLDWPAPGARKSCAYEAAGWSCRSTGFLWFSEVRDGGERLYPCPRCNTEFFLAESRRRASAEQPNPQCACCGAGIARLAYQYALDEAREERRRILRDEGPPR